VTTTTATRAILSLALLALSSAAPAVADTYEVDRTDDSTVGICNPSILGDCALRGAIIKANNHTGADTIRLAAHTYTLTIAGTSEDACQTGDLDILGTLTIEGKGPERTVIDAAGIDRVLHMLAAGQQLTVRGVTLTGGYVFGSAGAGVYAPVGSVRLDTCMLTGNEIQVGIGGVAVYSTSSAPGDWTEIFDSWITGNTAGTDAASILVVRTARIDGTTVSGNTAWAHPVVDVEGAGSLLINSTFETTGAYSGVAVSVTGDSTQVEGCTLISDGLTLEAAAADVRNTLLVGECTWGTTLTSLGGNLESPGNTCGLGASDLVNVANPMLSGLGFLGGPTPTHRPLPGSPAVDQPIAAAGCACVDQRGLARPRDGGGTSAAVCDIGAVELAGAGEIFAETFHCGFTTAWSTVVP